LADTELLTQGGVTQSALRQLTPELIATGVTTTRIFEMVGGLAAFGVPPAIAVPSVPLYRVLTCWLPVFIGWPVMRWLTRNDLI
jgi:hypothetical protein